MKEKEREREKGGGMLAHEEGKDNIAVVPGVFEKAITVHQQANEDMLR